MGNTVKERLIEYLTANNISKSEFGRRIGVSSSYVSAIRRSIDPDKIKSIALNYPNLNIQWLLYGEGDMIMSGGTEGTEISAKGARVPLIPIEAFCGFGTPAFSDLKIEEYYQVAEFRQADFLMRVKGNSMYPKYSSGDIVACKLVKERLFFQWNKIYAIYTTSQGVMVKRIRKSEKNGHILLVSDNERYSPFDVPLSDIETIALVIGVIRVE